MTRPILLLLAVLAQAPALAQAPPDSMRAITQRFPVGEQLVFDAKFGPLRLGRASMQVVAEETLRGEETVHFRFTLDAAALGVIRLHDQFDSWVGRYDFLSRRFHQDFNEPGQKRRNEYEIFPDSGIYYQNGVDTAMAASADPLDDSAFFYFVRTLDLEPEPGRRYEFNRYFRPDRNPVIIEVIGRDTIEVPAGRFPTVVIQPIIKGGGIFKESSDARMWISDDDRRLIVQMRSKFAFGSVTLRLTEFAGVRRAVSTRAVAEPDPASGDRTRGSSRP